jgi:hypothetical protein
MPRFDGTGPLGQGPMTGRGMGYCAVPADRLGTVPGLAAFPRVPGYYSAAWPRWPVGYGLRGGLLPRFGWTPGLMIGRGFRGRGWHGRRW